ncbi:hypothetical protein SLS62_002649 [Diatrype stigma]|uniref:Uncharacterized protein n=1 Tax=Diatrype stigma TaxID=117547 RepID=A0AAN9UYB0_9PEZI
MQVKNILAATALLCANTLATPLTAPLTTRDEAAACFPAGIQTGIPNLQGYISTVILDVAQQRYTSIGLDYSSTGRSLAFLERDILPDGCAPTAVLPAPATTADQAIAYLQAAQAELLVLAQDAINGDCADGEASVCRAVHLYGAVAQYAQSVAVYE